MPWLRSCFPPARQSPAAQKLLFGNLLKRKRLRQKIIPRLLERKPIRTRAICDVEQSAVQCVQEHPLLLRPVCAGVPLKVEFLYPDKSNTVRQKHEMPLIGWTGANLDIDLRRAAEFHFPAGKMAQVPFDDGVGRIVKGTHRVSLGQLCNAR